MSGKKGRSGRRKEPTTLMREALERLRGNASELLEELKQAALESTKEITCPACKHKHTIASSGDIQALTYLLDRIYGKAKQSMEVEGTVSLPPDFVRNLLEEAWARHKLSLQPQIEVLEIEGGDNGTEQRGSQGIHEE